MRVGRTFFFVGVAWGIFLAPSFSQYYGRKVQDEYGNQYELTDPNRAGSSYGNPYVMPRNFSQPNFNANGFSPQDTITPTQRALENYAAAEERRQLREQNIGWENVNNIQSALARGASIADQQSILEARAAATEAQKLANERERMAQRQLMLQEELAKKQIQQIEKQESNSPVQSQAVPAVLASSRTSDNYGGGQEMPPALERYKTEIKKIISSAKKEIDIHIVKGNIDAARNFKIPVNTIVTEDLDINTQIREFIQAEVEKFKHSSLQGFGH